MVVTVRIWMPQGLSVGHASMELSDGTYISFWPGNKSKKTMGMKSGGSAESLEEDIDLEERNPSLVFRIYNELDERAMSRAWESWKSDGFYTLIGFNCCYVVYQCLRAGGAPYVMTVVWRPETLRRYIQRWQTGSFNFLNMPWFD